MTYGRIDDKLHSHPKVIALGTHMLAAVGLGTLAQSWSNDALTDGFIPAAQVPRLAGRSVGPLVKALVTAGLWEVVEGGYHIHDWTDWNLTRSKVDALRTSRAEAGSLGGKQKASNLLANAVANGQLNRSPLDPNNQSNQEPTQRSIERRGAHGFAADHPAVTAYLAAARGQGISEALLYPKVAAIAARADELIADGISEADVVWAYSEIGRKGGAITRPDIELERRQRADAGSIIAGQHRTEAALRLLEEAGA